MSCQEYQMQIVLSQYDELNESERASLETHLFECTRCRQEHEEQQAFSNALTEDKTAWDLPSDMLMECRLGLADQLDRFKASCQEYQRQIVLSLYEELNQSERGVLETHLSECSWCQRASEEYQAFSNALAEDKTAWELPSDLLVESRRALANQLDRIETKRSWWRVPAFSVVFTPMRMLESATLIALGLAFGVYISNQQVSPLGPSAGDPAATMVLSAVPQNSRVSNVRIVNSESDSNTATVEFTGEVVQPLRFTGRLEDDTTRRLLFSALQDSMNPRSRMQAVEVLARKSSEPSVKEVLIHALLNDENLNVRLKAFDGLKPFAGDDDVRTAFMQALMRDPNDGIRVAVVDALAPFTKSEAMANSIEAVTRNDDNTYVRLKGQGLVHAVGDQR